MYLFYGTRQLKNFNFSSKKLQIYNKYSLTLSVFFPKLNSFGVTIVNFMIQIIQIGKKCFNNISISIKNYKATFIPQATFIDFDPNSQDYVHFIGYAYLIVQITSELNAFILFEESLWVLEYQNSTKQAQLRSSNFSLLQEFVNAVTEWSFFRLELVLHTVNA